MHLGEIYDAPSRVLVIFDVTKVHVLEKGTSGFEPETSHSRLPRGRPEFDSPPMHLGEIYDAPSRVLVIFDVTKVCLLEKRTSGFESETFQSAVECSTTELYPRKIGDYDVKGIPYVALFAIPKMCVISER